MREPLGVAWELVSPIVWALKKFVIEVCLFVVEVMDVLGTGDN